MAIHKFVIYADIKKYSNEDLDKIRDKAAEIFNTNLVAVQWHDTVPEVEEHPWVKMKNESR